MIAAGLAVLLYFAPKTQSAEKDEAKKDTEFNSSFEEAIKKIPADQKDIFVRLKQELIKAQAENNAPSWITAAKDFLNEARRVQDDQKAILYTGTIIGFEKALRFNPENLSAKTDLGAAIVESSAILGNPPMRGITLLREVIMKDSNNIEANLQLGLFSVNSRQFEKAIERFKRILRIDSTHIDVFVYLGNTYLSVGDTPKAIECFENYKTRIKDTLEIKEIDTYIKKLKQKQ